MKTRVTEIFARGCAWPLAVPGLAGVRAPRRAGSVLHVLAVVAMSLGVATAASADLVASGSGGSTEGWNGETGTSIVGQILGHAVQERLRLGGEFEYAHHKTDLLGVTEIDVDAYKLRAVLQIVAFPNRPTPYVGFGLGFDVMRYDNRTLAAEYSRVDVDRFGLGAGGVGFVGLQLPATRHFDLFAETRAGLSWKLVDDAAVDMGDAQLGGWSTLAGVRLRF